LVLIINNASYEDPTVDLTVRIDDTEVASGPVDVVGGHHWCYFPTKVPPGRHVITVAADTNAEPLRKRFSLPERGPRYGLITYWQRYKKDPLYLQWQFMSEQPMFG
jgi:hypothetical protein